MANEPLAERVAAVERLTQLFKAERMVHLAVTTISLAVLMVSATIMIVHRDEGVGGLGLGAMFGSSGLITYSASRLLHMWNQALALVGGKSIEDRNE